MIRSFKQEDLDSIMDIWLNNNITFHSFVPKEFWIDNYDFVKYALPNSTIHIFEEDDIVKGFVGVVNGKIEGIFVKEEYQSSGIGRKLLDELKKSNKTLTLSVFQKNERAIKFYQKNGFNIISTEECTFQNEVEYKMRWQKE